MIDCWVDGEKVEGEVHVRVSLQGDMAVLPFSVEDCDGVAWLALQQGPPGEVCRRVTEEEVDLSPRKLEDMQQCVFIGAVDHRSLAVLIDALIELRGQLIESTMEP